MSNDLDKVRYSHAGHDFHFLWTARRALKLLHPKSDLLVVSIEGISTEDSSKDEEGLLSVDTAEYYGSEKIEDAQKIKYFQLKYSTTAPEKEWLVAELSPRKKGLSKGTIVSFSKNFKENFTKYGEAIVREKFEYCFVTNRPIDSNIKELLALNHQDKSFDELPKKVQKVYTRLDEDTKLEKEEFKLFLKLLKFMELEDSREEQKNFLTSETNEFMPEFDTNVSIKLKELIHSRAMPEHANNPTIRKETLFHIFGITKIEDLLPAPPQFEKIENYIPREQESKIIDKILNASTPVVIHASGGIGKSSFAQNIVNHLPSDSKFIIFDGFANGSYRAPKDQRHLHKNGLVQIINEFAFDGLCLPILPTSTTSDNFLKIFYKRLKEVILEVQKNSSDAKVIIVLDAVDNTEMASLEYNERASFAKDLLQENPPNGCKIVALARTERLDILNLPHETMKIELKSFSKEETKKHLLNKFSNINSGELIEFHKLTFGNPRVQAYLLSTNEYLRPILKRLGKKGLSSDALIESQLESSLAKIKEQTHSQDDKVDLLCKTLTLLPPMIPIEVLEVATNIEQSLIYSFASDMGLALLIKDDCVQFRDEPVESWFKKMFKADKQLYVTLSDKLFSLSSNDPYIAMTLPRILFGAGEYERLYENVYNSEMISIDDPIQKERIILENITYAIKLAKQEKDFKNLTKLLLEASKFLSSTERHSEFIFQNSDLIATLVGAEFINDFLYRENHSNKGSLYTHSALMLSMESRFKAEARSFLRLANEYIEEWFNLPEEKRQHNGIDAKDISNMVLAVLYLSNEDIAVSEILRWKPKSFRIDLIRRVIKHLIEHNQDDKIEKILIELKKYPYLLSASIKILYQANKKVSKRDIGFSLKFLENQKVSDKLRERVISIVELALLNDFNKAKLLDLLEKFSPPLLNYAHSSYDGLDNRDLLLRYITLSKILEGKSVSVEDFIPDDSKKNEELTTVYGSLFKIYELKAKILCEYGVDRETLIAVISEQLEKMSSDSWKYKSNHNYHDLPFLMAYTCMDILILKNEVQEYKIILDWLQRLRNHYINLYVWINLIKKTRFLDEEIALNFVEYADETISSGEKSSQLSNDYTELSRAILPINKEDAKVYFEMAMEANLMLGYDARDRLNSLFFIAENINTANPKLAYEFLQVCERVEEFDDHKFSWYDVLSSLYHLDKPSSLAILSRLKNRGKICYFNAPSIVLNKLLKNGDITPKTYASIFVMTQNDNWKLTEGIEHILSTSIEEKEAISLLLKDFYMEYNERDNYSAKKIHTILNKYNVHDTQIDNLIQTLPNEDTYSLSHNDDIPIQIDWDKIFLNCDYVDKNQILEALENFRTLHKQYFNRLTFYEELRKRVPTNKRVEHLWNIADTFVYTDEFKNYKHEWTNISVQRAIPKIIDKLLKEKGEILSSFQLKEYIQLSSKPKEEALKLLLENNLNNLEEYSVYELLQIAKEVSSVLSNNENIEILSYGMKQFKDDIEEDTSDGVWSKSLTPPRDITESLGAFIYTSLGATRPEDRWRAMHTVRRLCKFGEGNILKAILKQLQHHDLKVFTDKKYTFYDMHSKLYLFMALARGVKENPQVLLEFSDIFSHYALEWLPHVLVRKYCSEIAINLEENIPNTYDSMIYEQIKQVNHSPYKSEKKSTSYHRERVYPETKLTIHMGWDFERYWFDKLSRVFNLNEKDISFLVEKWIVNEWAYSERLLSQDKRHINKIYRDNDTYSTHGSYPNEDNLEFYIIFHALFCVAGQLLKKYPTIIDSEEEDLWDYWLESHTLTRKDGKWISDRRDPMPIDIYVNFSKEQKDDNWEFSVEPKDFERCLRFREDDFKLLPISGHWKLNSEEVSIASILVNSKTSNALLRAYQTTNDPYNVYLPSYDNVHFSSEVKDKYFTKYPWVLTDSSQGLMVDEFDPLAKIAFPPRYPAPNIIRLHKLSADDEQRKWNDSNGKIVFLSEIWGDFKEYTSYGERLQIDYDFLLKFLKNLNKDLLIKIEIKREKVYGKSDHEYQHPYFKLFLFKKDGTVHELYRNYKIR